MDFTINKYNKLLGVLKKNGYSFQTFNDFLIKPLQRSIILRHDVDLLPLNSLQFAKIQNQFGIQRHILFQGSPGKLG